MFYSIKSIMIVLVVKAATAVPSGVGVLDPSGPTGVFTERELALMNENKALKEKVQSLEEENMKGKNEKNVALYTGTTGVPGTGVLDQSGPANVSTNLLAAGNCLWSETKAPQGCDWLGRSSKGCNRGNCGWYSNHGEALTGHNVKTFTVIMYVGFDEDIRLSDMCKAYCSTQDWCQSFDFVNALRESRTKDNEGKYHCRFSDKRIAEAGSSKSDAWEYYEMEC